MNSDRAAFAATFSSIHAPPPLEAKDFDAWLGGSLGPEALKPAPEAALREWTISPRMNRTGVGDDDPTIIEPLIASAQCESQS